MLWGRQIALVILSVLCAACSSRGELRTSTTSSGPIGCLDPRVPASRPAGGWLPDTTGALDYEPEHAGVERSPSAGASLLATRISAAVGHAFSVSNVQEFATATCVVDRDVVLEDPAGDVAFVRVIQLRQPLNDGSFPLVGDSMSRRHLSNGSVLLSNHPEDNSLVTAILAKADGLLVELQVRSRTGQDTAGWPTTFPTVPPSQPPVASPLNVAEATTATQAIAALYAPGA